MARRFRAFILGTDEAMPGDYILALLATFGVIAAVLAGMVV